MNFDCSHISLNVPRHLHPEQTHPKICLRLAYKLEVWSSRSLPELCHAADEANNVEVNLLIEDITVQTDHHIKCSLEESE